MILNHLFVIFLLLNICSESVFSSNDKNISSLNHEHKGAMAVKKEDPVGIFARKEAFAVASQTLDHEHEVVMAIRKIKSKGIRVKNETSAAATLSLFWLKQDGSKGVLEQTVPRYGSLTFFDDRSYVDLIPATAQKKVYTNLKRRGSKYKIYIQDKPADYGQFGRTGFGFDVNFLKHNPLHEERHIIHPAYFKSDGHINPHFLNNEYYFAMKKAQEKFEKADEMKDKMQALQKFLKAQENWESWVKSCVEGGDEAHRRFLEKDELTYLSHVIRPYDPTYGDRQEKRFQELLDARHAFDHASNDLKESAFERLFKAEAVWREWAEQYNGNVWFLEHRVLHGTGISRSVYIQHLNSQYEKHHPGKLPEYFTKHSVGSRKIRIPAQTHTIWFTHPARPVEFPYVASLIRSTVACPESQGFMHNLWVLDKKHMPETVAAIENYNRQSKNPRFSAAIQIKEFSDMGEFALKDFVLDCALRQRKMGMATDAFRVAVLEKQGGIYMDADYEMLQSVAPWTRYYDGVFNMEPMSSYIGNAFFMVKPHHPVMIKMEEIITRNLNAATRPAYINDVTREDPQYATISITGPGALTEAVAQALGKDNGRDVVLPHPFFYPSVNNIYPELDVHKSSQGIDHRFDVESWGVHKWHTTWAEEERFGSQG